MAAHDLDLYGPFDAGAGSSITEDFWRAMARNWLTSGPVRGELSNFAPSVTAGRNISIGAGRCFVAGHHGELSTAFSLPFAANTSGNPRKDRAVLRADFSANKVQLDVLQGTPGGSPQPPALTQNTSIWEISLLTVTLASGYTGIAATDWTDDRAFAQGRPPGGPLLAGCAALRTTNLPVGDAVNTAVDFDSSEDYDTAAIHSLGTNPGRFTIPDGMAGLWAISATVTFDNAVSATVAMMIYKNGSLYRTLYESTFEVATQPKVMPGYTEEVAQPGDYFSVYVYQNSGGAKNVTSARCSVRYLGPVA